MCVVSMSVIGWTIIGGIWLASAIIAYFAFRGPDPTPQGELDSMAADLNQLRRKFLKIETEVENLDGKMATQIARLNRLQADLKESSTPSQPTSLADLLQQAAIANRAAPVVNSAANEPWRGPDAG